MNIGIDIDEVLADLNPQFIDFLLTNYGLEHTRENWHSSRTEIVLGCTREEAVEKIHAFYDSPQFKSIKPIAGAVEAVEHLQKNHRLVVITARHDELTEATLLFLKEHFGSSFSEVYFTSHILTNGPYPTKAELCEKHGIDLLIDDNLKFALECSEKNIRTILLDAPWNQADELPLTIDRVKDWDEIIDMINYVRSDPKPSDQVHYMHDDPTMVAA